MCSIDLKLQSSLLPSIAHQSFDTVIKEHPHRAGAEAHMINVLRE
jgi:hypothetical protein